MVVPKSLTNSYGTLHGGASATLVDILGTMALVSVCVCVYCSALLSQTALAGGACH